ncbi:substrate-binding periplasmic protein [Bdellovibrio bacteriovorus]|uniref:Uncharacterized protein n=1 Tax=Bdellovibrio bacteriovorus str. Tiberius TaxID=1069642 RepID=K7YT64_BDEBC|nr:ABC transporter substrate-binding protein [Bdellovibrio bacteriovorus]AFY00818.1 hypothetical protein Bdt_1118 [Bdellovibrio bacteriovorus str. Tiberius]
MRKMPFLLSLIVTFLLTSVSAEGRTKRNILYAITSSHTPPLAYISYENYTNPTVEKGILLEIGVELLKEIGFTTTTVTIPKKRLTQAFKTKKVQMICHMNESWQSLKTDVLWSTDLYRNRDVIVTLEKTEIHKLEGKTIGTLVNYRYPKLESYFERHFVIREDAPTTQSNLLKLLNRRIDYAIMTDIEYNYFKIRHPKISKLNFDLGEVRAKCVISKDAGIPISNLNAAIDKFKRSGRFETIINSYNLRTKVPDAGT